MGAESASLPVTDYPDVEAFRAAADPIELNILGSLAKANDHAALDTELLICAVVPGEQDRGAARSRLNRALSSLEHKRLRGALVVSREDGPAIEHAELTDLGRHYAVNGTPETRLLNVLKERETIPISELRTLPAFEDGKSGVAIGALKRVGAAVVEDGVVRRGSAASPTKFWDLARILEWLRANGADLLIPDDWWPVIREHAVSRGSDSGLFRIRAQKQARIRLTADPAPFVESLEGLVERLQSSAGQAIGRLTPDLLRDGSWRGKDFRRWNLGLTPAAPPIGRRHPYREYLDGVKRKLAAMGFVEMVGNLVETEFWNMDALFMPQFHPAREIHDVYGIRDMDLTSAAPRGAAGTDPEFARAATVAAESTVAKVAVAHQDGGGTGSTGWRYHFDLERAKQIILRSHGTALSARKLGELGKSGVTTGKHFAVARCFRSDTIDATHAADFFQIEGIVLGPDINFRSLLGLLHLFGYEIAGAKKCRFVPAYFPFTEPSVEVHMQHPTLGWMELGGAGIFRPELTKPLGVDVPVIAWGLGVDRMAMVALGISDIRDLFHADLSRLREMGVPS